jgi:hypothetical protein
MLIPEQGLEPKRKIFEEKDNKIKVIDACTAEAKDKGTCNRLPVYSNTQGSVHSYPDSRRVNKVSWSFYSAQTGSCLKLMLKPARRRNCINRKIAQESTNITVSDMLYCSIHTLLVFPYEPV